MKLRLAKQIVEAGQDLGLEVSVESQEMVGVLCNEPADFARSVALCMKYATLDDLDEELADALVNTPFKMTSLGLQVVFY